MPDETSSSDGISRRTALQAGTGDLGPVGLTGAPSAHDDDNDDVDDEPDEADPDEADPDEANPDEDDLSVDESDKVEAEVIAEHAGFADDVAAMFTFEFADGEGTEPIALDLEDASNLVFFELNWEPGGSLDWHHHPGPVFGNVAEGELELTWERDRVPRTYAAGDSLADPGDVHIRRTRATKTPRERSELRSASLTAKPSPRGSNPWTAEDSIQLR